MVNRGPDGRRTNAAGLILTAVVFSLSAMAARGGSAQPAEDLGEQVQSLIGQLKAEDPEARVAAATRLSVLAWEGEEDEFIGQAISPLIEALGTDGSGDVRMWAAWALRCIVPGIEDQDTTNAAIASLTVALRDEATRVRPRAARALAAIAAERGDGAGFEPAIAPLIELLCHEDADLRKQAGVALGRIVPLVDDEAVTDVAIAALIEAFQDEEDPKAGWSSGEELVKLLVVGPHAVFPKPTAYCASSWAARPHCGRSYEPATREYRAFLPRADCRPSVTKPRPTRCRMSPRTQQGVLSGRAAKNALRQRMADRGIDLIAPELRCRKRRVQDRRKLRRYRRRWKMAQTFAWTANSRRLVVRYERKLHIYSAFFHLACIMTVLRALLT